MKTPLLFLFALTTAAQANTGAATELPSVDQIVARHIEATGGQAAWDRLSTQVRKGVALPGSANLALETAARSSGRWLFTLRLPNGSLMTHAFDGKEGWESRGKPAKMGPEASFEEGLIYNPFWILRFKEHFPKATLKGIEKNGDSEVYVIEAAPAAGRAKILYFDVGSGLMTRAGKVVYADYRDAGGIKCPFLVRYGWQTMQYSEVRHGEAVEEARFRMPAVPAKPVEAQAPETLPALDKLLDRYLAAAGGAGAVARLKTRTAKGAAKEGNQLFPLETFAKVPGKWLLVIQTGAGGVDREGSNGAAAWSESDDVVKDMGPEERAELDSFLDPQLPLTLDRLRPAMSVKRKETRGGQELYVVEAAPEGGHRRTLWFDGKTGMLARLDSVLFEDYRKVDGVRVPFIVRLHGGQIPVTLTEIRHDAVLDDARFERPSPSPAFEKNFAGLDDPQAVAVLKRVIGQGVSPSDGRMLYDFIVEKGYRRALDIGTARGYAALWLGLAMKKTGGKLITVEVDPETADEARENFRQSGLAVIIDSRINDALLEIPALKGDFDFVFMDTGSPLNKKFLDLLHARITPGGAITAHNAGSFSSQQPDFLKAIESDPNLETRIIPTRSGGISVSVRKK